MYQLCLGLDLQGFGRVLLAVSVKQECSESSKWWIGSRSEPPNAVLTPVHEVSVLMAL